MNVTYSIQVTGAASQKGLIIIPDDVVQTSKAVAYFLVNAILTSSQKANAVDLGGTLDVLAPANVAGSWLLRATGDVLSIAAA